MIASVHVLLEECAGAEASCALRTGKRGAFLTRMLLDMTLESVLKYKVKYKEIWILSHLLFFRFKLLNTQGAGVGTQMCLGMRAQLCGLYEAFATLVALVRSLARVPLHVAIEYLLHCKGLTALHIRKGNKN